MVFELESSDLCIYSIVLIGWNLLALVIYVATTRNHRYAKPGSLVFRVTSGLKYPHSIPSIAQALMSNWTESPFRLYACEPNRIYSICVSLP
jgi:hypothetical protein